MKALVAAIIFATTVQAADRRPWAYVYGGPATPVPLVEILKVSAPTLDPYGTLVLGTGLPLGSWGPALEWEVDANVSKYFERGDAWALAGGPMLRWLETPWHRVIPGSVAMGIGLSWASAVPRSESDHLTQTTRLLLYLAMEFDFAVFPDQTWRVLLRVHHRSGIFGIFEGVVGGSDYLCLGLKKEL